jgi:hypothetical protein
VNVVVVVVVNVVGDGDVVGKEGKKKPTAW